MSDPYGDPVEEMKRKIYAARDEEYRAELAKIAAADEAEQLAVAQLRRSERDARETRTARALEAILPHVKLVPTVSLVSGDKSWKIPGVVLLSEPDRARSYHNRVSLGAAKLIYSYELGDSESALLLAQIRKALLSTSR